MFSLLLVHPSLVRRFARAVPGDEWVFAQSLCCVPLYPTLLTCVHVSVVLRVVAHLVVCS
jgi:hypothetical protein